MITRAGSLDYVRVENGRNERGYKQTLPIISSCYWMAGGLKGLTDSM